MMYDMYMYMGKVWILLLLTPPMPNPLQIDYADKISATEQTAMETRAKTHMRKHNRMLCMPTQ